ncbi:MAG: TIGR00730 family Rossman fold protein [Vampirovibrionia bacterium]
MTKTICIYCSSSDAVDTTYFETAIKLSEIMAKRNHKLVYGGASVGLMGTLAKTIHKNGGYTIGIMPEGLADKGISFENCDEFIVTKNMRDRKATMEDMSEAFIALPGGFGTLEELMEIITGKQLSFHTKAIVILNTNGFYDKLIELFEQIYSENFAKSVYKELYYVTDDPLKAIEYIENYVTPIIERKWY